MNSLTLVSLLAGFLAIALAVVTILLFRQRVDSQRELENRYNTLLSFHRIYQLILESLDYEVMIQKIADMIPNELRFATGVLAILDEKTGTLKRVAASHNVPFEQIEISIHDQNNLMAKAVRENKLCISTDVYDVLGPALSREQAKKVQEITGTKSTFVYPILIKGTPIGVFIANIKKQYKKLSSYELEVMNSFVNLIGLALQDSGLYTSLRSTTKKLYELDQLKDDFVYVASHELRTPMTAIRSYAWMALHHSDVSLSDKVEKYLVRIVLSTERLINLVNDMLNISRIESGRIEIKPEAVDLILLCKDIIDEVYYSKSIDKKVDFVLLEQELPKVFADPEKLRQVLLNIIGNALKFSPNEGKITVGFFTDGKTVETYVKDEGPGISYEDLGRLFKKFGRLGSAYTAVAASGGTGLGLYISKSLIELMRGKIWVKSEGVGKGATFTCALPVASKSNMIQSF